MRLLLDSHAFLWFCAGDSNLSKTARTAIENSNNQKFIGHGTAWEIAIKLTLGKLKLNVPYEDLFPGALDTNGFTMLDADVRHYRELILLPMLHRDPFDRLLVAQAKVEQMSLVSRDLSLAAYGIPIIW
jgi:PIN domain nuclease of toxin-antitoxin system